MLRRAAAGGCLLLALVLSARPVAADLPEPEHDPEDVRATADEVLSRPEFDRPEPSLIERAQQWVTERINRVLEDLIGGGSASLIGWVVLALAIAATVFFATRLGRTVQRDPGIAASVDVDPGRSGADWRAEAERYEAEGRWKEALRSRYRALVTDLVRAGVVEEIAGRTTGEYRRDVAQAAPPAAKPFSAATELFELAWYGDRPTAEEESRRFRELAADAERRAGLKRVA